MSRTHLSTVLWTLSTAFILGLLSAQAAAHGGRHSENFDRRDSGWLSRWNAAAMVIWGTPRYNAETNRADIEILKVLKSAPYDGSVVAVPESPTRAKALGTEPQLIFLTRHEAAPDHVPFHWSIGRHDHRKEVLTIENVENYFTLQVLVKKGKCTRQLAETLAGLTYQTPPWLSKLSLLDAFDFCRSFLPKVSPVSRHYLREGQRRHQSGHKQAAPGR